MRAAIKGRSPKPASKAGRLKKNIFSLRRSRYYDVRTGGPRSLQECIVNSNGPPVVQHLPVMIKNSIVVRSLRELSHDEFRRQWSFSRIPLRGYGCNITRGSLTNAGTNGNYWSAGPNSVNNGYNLNFNSGNTNPTNNNNRANGFSVRPVSAFTCRIGGERLNKERSNKNVSLISKIRHYDSKRSNGNGER